jgi:hypothetical protein
MPPERHFVFEASLVRPTLSFARAEFALLAPFAPTSEPAPLVAVCLSLAMTFPPSPVRPSPVCPVWQASIARPPRCTSLVAFPCFREVCWIGLTGQALVVGGCREERRLGLPVQRAAFRPAPSRRSVEVPIERQQEVAP